MTRYALITGASSGIGLALAEALARRGRSLILVARQRDALESIALELTQRFGVEVLFRACDLGEPLRLSGFLLELEEGDRQIDLLVNCAGIGTCGPFLAHDWSAEQDLIELNVLALTRLCHAIGNMMAVQGGGQILNVSSIAAFQPGPWLSTYFASKAYVLHFSEGLREEVKKTGIKVSVLCPGITRTRFFRRSQNERRQGQAKRRRHDARRSCALYRTCTGEKQGHHHSWPAQSLDNPHSTRPLTLDDAKNSRRNQQILLPALTGLGVIRAPEYTRTGLHSRRHSFGYPVHQNHQP